MTPQNRQDASPALLTSTLNRETTMKTNLPSQFLQKATKTTKGPGDCSFLVPFVGFCSKQIEPRMDTDSALTAEYAKHAKRQFFEETVGGASVPASRPGFAYLASFAVPIVSSRLCAHCDFLWLPVLGASAFICGSTVCLEI